METLLSVARLCAAGDFDASCGKVDNIVNRVWTRESPFGESEHFWRASRLLFFFFFPLSRFQLLPATTPTALEVSFSLVVEQTKSENFLSLDSKVNSCQKNLLITGNKQIYTTISPS